MPEITTALVHENEIAKSDDFLQGFTSLIKNTAVLDRMLVSADIDYVVGGEVVPDAATLGIRIGKLWGNGNSLEMPIFQDKISDLIHLTSPLEDIRVDTVQVRCLFEEYDKQRRSFFNPDIEAGQYYVVPTKLRLKTEYIIKKGTEGQGIAPEADKGWIKLAEIYLEPEMVTLPEESVKNVTAIFQSEENASWTNQKNRTFNLGSLVDLKTMFAKEHDIGGHHRDRVIKANNIDFGTGSNQVNGIKIPLGGDFEVGSDRFEALDSYYDAFIKEVLYRRANHASNVVAIQTINQIIEQMLIAIDGLMPKAPNDGPVYGGKNKTWVEIEKGGAGDMGLFHELYKAFSKKSLMITNRTIVDRRLAGWDIGLPYLSKDSRVYHFDTDLNDQSQKSEILITYAGDAPMLRERTDTNGQIYFNPAVIDEVPHEMAGRSLYGFFSLSAQLAAMSTFTMECWVRLFYKDNAIVLRLASATESIVFKLAMDDPEYSVPGDDGVPYSVPGDDGVPYSETNTSSRNSVTHTWSVGTETVYLDESIEISEKTWIHIAAVSTPESLSLFIGKARVDFVKRDGPSQQTTFTLNEWQREFNVDELSINPGVAVDFGAFSDNTENRIPYAALDHHKKWFVLEAQDPALIKTNLFDSEQFKAAVQAVIDQQGE
jgi:hypothetical protein